MPDQPRLLLPSPGVQLCIRRLLEARPESTQEAWEVLKRTWPRIEFATADLAFAHYLDATTPDDVPDSTVVISVAPIG